MQSPTFHPENRGQDAGAFEGSSMAMRRMSRVLMILFFALAVLFGIAFIVLAVTFLSSMLLGNASSLQESESTANGLLSLVGLCIDVAIFVVTGLVFKDVSAGESPFNRKQATRIRVIAWLLLAYAFLDSFIPTGIMIASGADGVAFGVNRNEISAPSIRLGPILFALVFFFLSSVFSYGVKLQELSDDVL